MCTQWTGAPLPATLRLEETTNDQSGLVVRLTLREGAREQVYGPFDVTFSFGERDREDLRWYLEDFLSFAEDPAPRIAARVEARIRELGEELFRAVFETHAQSRQLWAEIEPRLALIRFEVGMQAHRSSNVPWELLRTPGSAVVLAREAQAFVRYEGTSAAPVTNADADPVLRILLVISRPGGAADVPYRSIAAQLLRTLKTRVADRVELQVLRPPSFARLQVVLEEAHADRRSFDVVHFDGHGVYADLKAAIRGDGPKAEDMRGYLAFENDAGDATYVTGELLGNVLGQNGVRLLVLNACQSAHAEPTRAPASTDDAHREETFGSLAQEVVRTSGCAVVAMQYKLYVTTAAQFIADLYRAFQAGVSIGEAVTVGRRGLAERPHREVGLVRRELQDWIVPIVYENTPTQASRAQPASESSLSVANELRLPKGVTPAMFPPRAGFIGRDATLLELDRAFRQPAIVQLIGYAGIGKTSTAIEFTSWLRDTGGLPPGPVLYTVFSTEHTLERVLDDVMERGEMGVVERTAAVLELLAASPGFWIWDAVDSIEPDAAAMSALAAFLTEARRGGTRFLLLSRKEQDALPSGAVVAMRPLGFDDRVRFARAAFDARGRTFDDPERWAPLLDYSQGNPMVLDACISQGLAASTAEQIAELTESLRAGTVELADSDETRRCSTLRDWFGAVMHRHFSVQERVWLSFLFLFRGYVNVTTFQIAGLNYPWTLPQWRGVTWERIHPLLERLADLGALARANFPGCYRIHPLLTSVLRAEAGLAGSDEKWLRAYCELYNFAGAFAHKTVNEGQTDLAVVLVPEEENYLYVRRAALERRWYLACFGAMQALQVIYYRNGQFTKWRREVEAITPHFIQEDETPFPGRTSDWEMVMYYRAQLADVSGDRAEAQRLQKLLLQHVEDPQAAADDGPHPWGIEQQGSRETADALMRAATLNEHGAALLQQRDPACIDDFNQSLQICRGQNHAYGMSMSLLNLGNAYSVIPESRDLARADECFNEAMALANPDDHGTRGQILAQMGLCRYLAQLELEGEAKRTVGREALDILLRAEALLSVNPAILSAVTLNLGIVQLELGETKAAVGRFLEAIRLGESHGQTHDATSARYNLVQAYLELGDLQKAYTYALQLRQTDRDDESIASLLSQIEALAKPRGVTLHVK